MENEENRGQFNKGKIRSWSWDMYSKLNVGQKHPSGCSFQFINGYQCRKTKWKRIQKDMRNLLVFYL